MSTHNFDSAAALAAAGEDPGAREAALVRILNQANEVAIGQRELIQGLTAKVEKLTQDFAGVAASRSVSDSGRRDRREPLSRIRGFDRLPHFSGKEDEFDTWMTKVTTFLQDEPGLSDIMKRAARATQEIRPEHLNELQEVIPEGERVNVQWYSQQLHTGLMMLTEKTPYAIVKNADGNGLEAWRRLHAEYASVTPQGKRQLLWQLLNYH
jgi:hypothetical protein